MDYAKEKLTTDEVNNKLLLAIDTREQIAWHLAELGSNSESQNRNRKCLINKQ